MNPKDPTDPTLYYRGLQLQGSYRRGEITGREHPRGSSERVHMGDLASRRP